MSIWSDLIFSAGKSVQTSAQSIAGNLGFTWTSGNDPVEGIEFKSKAAHKTVATRVAQQIAMQIAEAEVNKLFPRLQKQFEENIRNKALKQTENNKYHTLIKGGQKVDGTDYASVPTSDNAGNILARDYLGRKIPEALILSYAGKDKIEYTFAEVHGGYWARNKGSANKVKNYFQSLMGGGSSFDWVENDYSQKTTISTNDVIHIDIAPEISLSSDKNLIMTTVQGRDFTRKELISGGDLSFSISGNIVSDIPGEYPSSAVQRFINIAQYKGIVKVSHYFFDQLNVKQIIIKDFNLGQQEYKNIQPYSFNCVAVETNDIIIRDDTIGTVNKIIQGSKLDTWYNLVLNNKLVEMAAKNVANATNAAVSKGIDIEGLINHI